MTKCHKQDGMITFH